MISVTGRSDLSERFLGADIGASSDPRFVGYGIAVTDIDAVEALVRGTGVACQRRGLSLWLCTEETSNVIVEFTQIQVTV